MDQNNSYEVAYKELQQIAREIETETVSVDVLAQKVKRASELITFCQNKLRATETEVNKIIEQLEKGSLGKGIDSGKEE
jgi:exodeoxyribonuclease VII small subunit